jgi:uncharacterized protein (TIGR03382 family)
MRSILLGFAISAAIASPAFAHIELTYPAPRSKDQIKTGPCGQAGSTRSSKGTKVEPGATITVTWDETVPHEGHYRIAFDDNGQDFPLPKKVDAADGRTVLADGIPDPGDAQDKFQREITLPDIECDNCTLQLIQVMSTAASNWPASSMYFTCADLVLERGAGVPPPPGGPGGDDDPSPDDDPSTDPATGGCAAGGVPGILVALALVPAWRRRRR